MVIKAKFEQTFGQHYNLRSHHLLLCWCCCFFCWTLMTVPWTCSGMCSSWTLVIILQLHQVS